ncbi:MAG TPA: hypothetical protein VIY49_08985 [Bryobacteraceae bacterium]
MGRTATGRTYTGKTATVALLASLGLWAQSPSDWRHLGNSLLDLSLAGLATGPIERVWYSADGGTLFLSTASHKTFQTTDLDTWTSASGVSVPPVPREIAAPQLPEIGASVRAAAGQGSAFYAFSKFVYRSQDGGLNWDNLTAYRGQSIVGTGLQDLAVSPRNPDEIVVAGSAGVFRSVDGGKSWSGMNQDLPNLPGARLRSVPSGEHGAEIELTSAEGPVVMEWPPGEKQAWKPADSSSALNEFRLRQIYSQDRGAAVTAISSINSDTIYLGLADGRISVSTDGGRTWSQTFSTNGGPVEGFWVDPKDQRVALAALGSKETAAGAPHILRTENSGGFWDDLRLPDVPAHGVAGSRASGFVYAATSNGIYYSRTDLNSLAGNGPWQLLMGLPEGPVTDVRLDEGENQLYAIVEGFGVYSTLAPHRLSDPRVVSAADFVARAAAPGALMTVLGTRVATAKAGDLTIPVLAAGDRESQIQIPFEARGGSLALALDGSGRAAVVAPLALEPTAPAIVVDPDGTPILLDSTTQTLLDAMNPAHSQTRVQIWATGLGGVNPEWPTGMAAPLDNPPVVTATVHAMLDGSPVEVTRATLTPGYTGFYLVEVEIPKIVNYGPAQLYLEADGHKSNPVRIYIEP